MYARSLPIYEIYEFFPIHIVYLGSFHEKRIPERQSIARAGSFTDLFQETIAVFEREQVLAFDFAEFWIGEQNRFVEKISAETRSEIEYVHLHRRKKDCSKRHDFEMTGSRYRALLREEMHLSLALGMSDPPVVREIIFHECSCKEKCS